MLNNGFHHGYNLSVLSIDEFHIRYFSMIFKNNKKHYKLKHVFSIFQTCVEMVELFCSPKLTWRDLKHLVVMTSHKSNLQDRNWRKNGVGRWSESIDFNIYYFYCYLEMLINVF